MSCPEVSRCQVSCLEVRSVIVTVTPNPSLDLTYLLDREPEEVNRATSWTLEASGKGVNVSRTLVLAGRASLTVLPVGGVTGHQVVELLGTEGIPHRPVTQAGATRVNTTVLRPRAATEKFNAPGGALTRAEVSVLLAACETALDEVLGAEVPDAPVMDTVVVDAAVLDTAVREAGLDVAPGAALPLAPGVRDDIWLAVCGSLPAGVEPTLVGDLVRAARSRGVRCVVDTSGPALLAAAEAGADLLAPNVSELAGISPTVRDAVGLGLDAVAIAAASFARQTGCALLVSAGAAGAIWTDGASILHAQGPSVEAVNTAGAGDALLAGWLAGPARPGAQAWRRRLVTGVSWGAAACLCPTTVCPTLAHTATGSVIVKEI